MRGRTVVVNVRVANCHRCTGRLYLRVRKEWRNVLMRSSRTGFVGRMPNVPSGRWIYFVSLKDPRSGLEAHSAMRSIRVR